MKVSEAQIQTLYRFTREHFVEFYDVQTELVDHLANGIEQQWTENPKLTFEEALQKEFKKFGVFGFQDVIEQRSKALNKKYLKIFWKHFKNFFKLPRIIATLGAFGILYQALTIVPFKAAMIYTLMGLLALILLFKSIKIFKIAKNRQEQTGKKWMLESYVFGFGNSFLVLNLIIQINSFIINGDVNFESPNFLLYFSIFYILFSLFAYITLFEIPSKAEEYLKQTYPEYEMLKEV